MSDSHARAGVQLGAQRMRRITVAIAVVAALLSMTMATPASATNIGREGKIAFVRANQIYIVAKTCGAVKLLTTSGKNYRPKWSPDGKRIASINETAAGMKDIWEMSATGTNKVRVTTTGTVTSSPVWEPDGTTLAFAQTASVIVAQLCQGPYPPPDCPPPYTSSGNFVFLVKATAPFGTPNYLRVQPVYREGLDSEPITAYAGGSLAWWPNGAELVLINNDSEYDGPDTGMHEIHSMAGAAADNASLIAHEEFLINATGGSCCGSEDWSDLNYIPDGVLGYSAR